MKTEERRFLWLLGSLAVLHCCMAALASSPLPWHAVVGGQHPSSAEALAAVDLQRYLAQVTHIVPVALEPGQWRQAPRPAIILGTPTNNPLLRRYRHLLDEAGEEGFILQYEQIDKTGVLVAAGKTPAGAVNAIYGLLHELGFGFYLGSEALPDELPNTLALQPGIHRPVFRIRGVLPWYNFLNSPTTWESVDHRAFIDQLARMRANFLGFHVYDNEPFAAYEREGRMVRGKRLLNTQASLWSTHPMPTSQFAAGSAELFSDDYFGAETTREPGDDIAIRREQQVMREALAYAKQRGLHPCLGFEVQGDPTQPAERDDFLCRFEHVLEQYPDLDYVWLWQPEIRGMRGTAVPLQELPGGRYTTTNVLGKYGLARRQIYQRAAEAHGTPRYGRQDEASRIARAVEGARLELYAQLACRALAKRKAPPRLVLSGWGGEDRMVSAEYYEGLDQTLPKSVVFASLDYIVPRPRVDSIYGQLPPDRERWPIPWYEFDGDQWHPQSFVHTYEGLLKDAQRSGSQGILGIHWRTREVEENVAYTMQFAWSPTMTAEDFYGDYARRCFARDIAQSMAEVLSGLDQLGYRWVGGRGQAEYNRFTWGPGIEPAKVDRLKELLARCRELLPQAGRAQARLDWLIHRMEYVLKFQEAETAAVAARDLLARASQVSTNETRSLGRQALHLLDPELMNQALRAYCLRVSTRGELGVLATINTKAVYDWQELTQKAAELCGNKPAAPGPWLPEPHILMPRLIGSCVANHPLELTVILLGAKPVGIQPGWVHYRKLGETTWSSDLVSTVNRSVCFAVVPARVIRPPGVEVAFSFSENPAAPFAYGPIAITGMPASTSPVLRAASSSTSSPFRSRTLRVSLKTLENGLGALVWNDLPAADYFRVLAGDSLLAETPLPFLPCLPESATAASYCVEAWRDGKRIAASHPVGFKPGKH